MLVSFLESLRYVGHLFPLSVLRIYMGYVFFVDAIEKKSRGFLEQPLLVDQLQKGMKFGSVPPWYEDVVKSVMIPHWQWCAYLLIFLQLFVGASYLIGYVVRPAAIIGMVLSLHFLAMASGSEIVTYQTFVVIHMTLGWLGAGRCLGIDYYFYKRHRGYWW